MAKKKSSKLTTGAAVRIKQGTPLPEFPDVCIDDWTAIILETKGRGADLQYIIEWDDATVEKMPQSYQDQCEEQGLFFRMACLPADQVEQAMSDAPDA
ncbi:MAG: hypothetical protein KDA86_03090 [Planctomycetaceae bacterium]|nr:hypothetical protein [Planctomycetaceae bacterium]